MLQDPLGRDNLLLHCFLELEPVGIGIVNTLLPEILFNVVVSAAISDGFLLKCRGLPVPEPVLMYIKKRYYVSMKTVLFRAEQAGIISSRQRGQQMGKLIEKYGKINEGELLEKPKLLSRLERLVFQALADEKISSSRAAEILGQSIVDIRKVLLAWVDEEAVA